MPFLIQVVAAFAILPKATTSLIPYPTLVSKKKCESGKPEPNRRLESAAYSGSPIGVEQSLEPGVAFFSRKRHLAHRSKLHEDWKTAVSSFCKSLEPDGLTRSTLDALCT